MSLLGLESIPPSKKRGARSLLSAEEWDEIFTALARGVSKTAIYQAVGRYASFNAFCRALKYRARADLARQKSEEQ